MQLARSPEEDEDKETAPHPCHSPQAFQVHGTARSVQETFLPRCFPFGVETEQHCGQLRLRILFIRRGGSCW